MESSIAEKMGRQLKEEFLKRNEKMSFGEVCENPVKLTTNEDHMETA